MRTHLNEHFGEHGGERDKLRALICCIRHRKSTGYEQPAIAKRAKLTRQTVREILAGDFDKVDWEPIEAVLEALRADGPEITVAAELYERIASTRPPLAARPAPPPPAPGRKPPPLFSERVFSPTTTQVPSPPPVTVPLPPTSTAGKDETTVNSPHPADGVTAPSQADHDHIGSEDDEEEDHQPPGYDQELDPMDVQTVEDFTTAMEVFRARHGQRPLRQIAQRCKDHNIELTQRGLEIREYSAGSYSNVIKDGRRGKLSAKELVLSYIAGAGASVEELEHWAKAWIRIKTMDIQSKNPRQPGPPHGRGREHQRPPAP